MLAELIALMNALLSWARLPLDQKQKKLLNQKIEPASHILEKASQSDIERYDKKLKELANQIERNRSSGEAFNPDPVVEVERILDGIIGKANSVP
jgi:hypothetical protein